MFLIGLMSLRDNLQLKLTIKTEKLYIISNKVDFYIHMIWVTKKNYLCKTHGGVVNNTELVHWPKNLEISKL